MPCLNKSAFAYWEALGLDRKSVLTKWFMVGNLGPHGIKTCLLEKMGTKVSHADVHLCLHDWTRIKTLDTKAWASLFNNTSCILLHITLIMEKQLFSGQLASNESRTLSCTLFPWLIFTGIFSHQWNVATSIMTSLSSVSPSSKLLHPKCSLFFFNLFYWSIDLWCCVNSEGGLVSRQGKGPWRKRTRQDFLEMREVIFDLGHFLI